MMQSRRIDRKGKKILQYYYDLDNNPRWIDIPEDVQNNINEAFENINKAKSSEVVK